MAWSDFYEKNRTIIIVLIVLFILFIFYRYLWLGKYFRQDLQFNAFNSRLSTMEKNLGLINQSVTSGIPMGTPEVPSVPQTPNQPIIQPSNQMCMTTDAQKMIADEINKKLQEINACDCREACAMNNDNNNNNNSQQSMGSQQYNQNGHSNTVEYFY